MDICIIAIGKARQGPERDLFEQYRTRIRGRFDLHELDLRKRIEPMEQRREAEAELIRAALPAGAVLICLDEQGEQIGSETLAATIGKLQDQGERNLAFVIGGADGLAPSIKQQARRLIAFGRATWPHMLVRAMLAEQIYRAQSINDGHPYHRG